MSHEWCSNSYLGMLRSQLVTFLYISPALIALSIGYTPDAVAWYGSAPRNMQE